MNRALTRPDHSADALMGEIGNAYLEQLARGEHPDAEEYARRYPGLATVLRHMLPALQLLHPSGPTPAPAAGGPSPELTPEGSLGDFRLVREIGRGGMGVVYEAVQISLGRRVALKVLPFAAALDARQLQRFKNEAQAAAHLHHQHIVPVHAVGCERGVHFYAMQYIEGHTLAALIEELGPHADREMSMEDGGSRLEESKEQGARASTLIPRSSILDPRCSTLDPRLAAGLAVQAAVALEHAHRQGIIHRDIKPANLLLDSQGNLWVTDFGLAQVQTDCRLTLTGDLVGTLRYMSPEQAVGPACSVDLRTDLYALGATLYELLTLEPVFGGRDRQALLRQITSEEPRPLRRLNPAVPVELETIVLKLLAKNPAERYATAQELADDLERFLRDEPIRARRPTPAQRARKWTRRHRPVVWSVAAGLLVAGAVLAGSLGWIIHDQVARQTRSATAVQDALARAREFLREGKRSEALAAARGAETLLAGSGEARLGWAAADVLADLAMLARLDEIHLRGSAVRDGHFDFEGPAEGYAAAFRDYGLDVAILDPAEAAERIRARPIRVELAAALDGWAMQARWLPGAAETRFQGLLAIAGAADPDPRRGALRDALMRGDTRALVRQAGAEAVRSLPPVTVLLLADGLAAVGELAEATAVLRKAQEQYASDFWINHHYGFALMRASPPQWDEAIRYLTAAVALRPESAGARLNLGFALCGRGRYEAALASFRQALELEPDYAEAHCNVGLALDQLGWQEEALAALRRALTLKPQLVEAHHGLGLIHHKHGRPDEAIAAYRQACEICPDWAPAHHSLGCVLAENGRLDEALAALNKAVVLNPTLADAYGDLGNLWLQKGRPDEAVAAYAQLLARRPADAEAHCSFGAALDRQCRPDEAIKAFRQALALKPGLLRAQHNLAIVLTRHGRSGACEAITLLHRILEQRPDDADVFYDLGLALQLTDRLEEAAGAYRRALTLRPDHAESYCNLGVTLRLQGKFAEALAALRRGHELGAQRPDWPYRSAQWVEECQRMSELAGRLPAVLRGEAEPADAAERITYALLCCEQKRYAAAARFWTAALTADPHLADDLEAEYRHDAACAAAQAGQGQGTDGAPLDADERVRWRTRALDWLRADLAAKGRLLSSAKPKDRALVCRQLREWQNEEKLAGLRDPASVLALPADEQESCKRLWAEVRTMLARAETPSSAQAAKQHGESETPP
jgi:serine/threonine protein kinase/Flp pilus assembly protein TadD